MGNSRRFPPARERRGSDGVGSGKDDVGKSGNDEEEKLVDIHINHTKANTVTSIMKENLSRTSEQAHKQAQLNLEVVEAIEALKTEFIQNMSHSFRTPFNGLLGLSSYLLEQEDDEQKKEFLTDIVQCAQKLFNHVDEILTFAESKSGKIDIKHEEFSIRELIKDVCDIEIPASKEKGLVFKTEIADDIPEGLVGDRHRVFCILINLIGNAIKFTRTGSVVLKIELKDKTAEQTVVKFIVQDEGIGIPKDKFKSIFFCFSRLTPSYQGEYEGLGLGLSIVKQYVCDLKGNIELKSKLNHGSIFTCLLPFVL